MSHNESELNICSLFKSMPDSIYHTKVQHFDGHDFAPKMTIMSVSHRGLQQTFKSKMY